MQLMTYQYALARLICVQQDVIGMATIQLIVICDSGQQGIEPCRQRCLEQATPFGMYSPAIALQLSA